MPAAAPVPSVAPASLLAFDSSTESMAVAACGPAGEAVWTGAGGAAASSTLLPRVNAALAEAGLALADLDAIAFGAGPGAFTGLRTACAVAQGLGFGIGRPLLAVDSLLIVAEAARWHGEHGEHDDLGGLRARGAGADASLWVAMDARMDEVYAGAYRRQGGSWIVDTAPALYTLAALAVRWAAQPPACVAGSAPAAFGGRLPLAGARVLAEGGDRAAALLRLARQAWAAGPRLDPADARPLYLRDKVALTSAERDTLRQAPAAALASGAA